jgi:hypothetical protein
MESKLLEVSKKKNQDDNEWRQHFMNNFSPDNNINLA